MSIQQQAQTFFDNPVPNWLLLGDLFDSVSRNQVSVAHKLLVVFLGIFLRAGWFGAVLDWLCRGLRGFGVVLGSFVAGF